MAHSDKIKHLEMIQTIIARMAGNSFLLKGWSLTVVMGLLAFALDNDNPFVALLALAPVGVFWSLDGFFLSQERRFRALYDEVRQRPSSEDFDFSMVPPSGEPTLSWNSALHADTLRLFHGMGLVAAFVVCVSLWLRAASPAVVPTPWNTDSSADTPTRSLAR